MKRRPDFPKPTLGSTLAVAGLLVLAIAATFGRGKTPLQSAGEFNAPELTLGSTDRILILAPHPDDESHRLRWRDPESSRHGPAGAGGLPDQRRRERVVVRGLSKAAGVAAWPGGGDGRGPPVTKRWRPPKILGLRPEQLTFLGYPDFGTLRIWTDHWGNRAGVPQPLHPGHAGPLRQRLSSRRARTRVRKS